MDIHKPKAAHSWREFLIEIGTIICGILIALSLEQALEWLHWRHEVAETRRTLAGEIARNIDRLERRKALTPCFARRLDDIHRYLLAGGSGRRDAPPRAVGTRLGVLRLNTNAWESAKAAQLMAHMPPEERERYSRLYNEFEFALERLRDEGDTLNELRLLSDAPMLESADWSRMRAAWNRATTVSNSLNTFVGPIIDDARSIVGPMDRVERSEAPVRNATEPRADVMSMNRELCQPWYPAG